KLADVLSPQRLAESYNPSIGLADGSSRNAGCSGKTVRTADKCGENAADLSAGRHAGYHPIYSFAVQLSKQESASDSGRSSFGLLGHKLRFRWHRADRNKCHPEGA